MRYFVTGATGFIGRHLVERAAEARGHDLRARAGGLAGAAGGAAVAWERARRPGRARDRRPHGPGAGRLGGRPRAAAGRRPLLPPRRDLRHVGRRGEQPARERRRDPPRGRAGQRAGRGHFHHTSSIAVSGRYRGLFREDMFDEGQKLADPYSRTKFESEKLVRDEATVPWRVYRPGIVVGHSQTGEMDKIDGPYYFFKVIQRLRDLVPQWMPVVGPRGRQDQHRARSTSSRSAMDHIAHQPGLDGQAFHLTDPKPEVGRPGDQHVRARGACARVRDADRPPDDERRAEAGAQDDRPAAAGEADHRSGAGRLRHPARGALLHRLPERLRLPRRAARARGHGHLGAGAGGLRRPAVGLLGAQPRPRPVQGPQPARRDRGQGGRDHRRLERHRPRARAEGRRGRRHRRAGRALRGQAGGDEGRDRGAGRRGHRPPGRPVRSRRLRPAGRGDPGRARPRRHPGQQRRAARSAARSRTRTTASTTTSARCSSTTSAR